MQLTTFADGSFDNSRLPRTGWTNQHHRLSLLDLQSLVQGVYQRLHFDRLGKIIDVQPTEAATYFLEFLRTIGDCIAGQRCQQGRLLFLRLSPSRLDGDGDRIEPRTLSDRVTFDF